MDEILIRLRDDLLKALGDNLICLLQTGSRERGEATEESDYDVFLGVQLLDTLDNWGSCKSDLAKESKYCLFLLEKFFRESRP